MFWQVLAASYNKSNHLKKCDVTTNRRSVYKHCFHSWFIYLLDLGKVSLMVVVLLDEDVQIWKTMSEKVRKKNSDLISRHLGDINLIFADIGYKIQPVSAPQCYQTHKSLRKRKLRKCLILISEFFFVTKDKFYNSSGIICQMCPKVVMCNSIIIHLLSRSETPGFEMLLISNMRIVTNS